VKSLGDNYAPYAPAGAVISVIKQFREKGLSEPITQNLLEQIGVPSTMVGPTMRALLYLQLIDESGNFTRAFDRLRRASSEEYPKILAEIVRKAYLPIFTIVDPTNDSDIAIADAFRRYDPANQRQKMVRLFIGLCKEAQVVERQTRSLKISVRTRKEDSATQSSPLKQSTIENKDNTTASAQGEMKDYRLISAIIQHLPTSGYWTPEQRKRWLDALSAAVDLIIQTKDS
jgi:hypothetical protein